MTKYKDESFLDNEEQQIVADLENQSYKPVKNLSKEKERLQKIASYNMTEKKSINIRPLKVDILKIKAKAEEEWIPYQTLINSVIHKFANNKLVSK